MQQTEAWTIGRLLQWTTDFLKKRGSDSPRLDAEVLLAHARGCQRIQLYTAFDEEPAEDVRVAFRELVRRRSEGMPVAYLVGQREFYSLMFRVTPDVLIPRPETEFLLIALLDLAKEHAGELAIVDVGTGSGILAVCAARKLPQARVTALDISPAALDVARQNADSHGVADRISLLESDLLAALPAEATFDFVVSNPPYVKSAELEQLSPEVKDHEPRSALDGGTSGTAVIERLIEQAAGRLNSGGWLLMEIGPTVEAAVRNLISSDSGWKLEPTKKDLAGLPRVIMAQRRA